MEQAASYSPSTSSSSLYPINTFAQLTAYPPIFGSFFAEIIPIHLNPEYFPNEIPLALPIRPADQSAIPQSRRGRPPKPQEQKKVPDLASRPKTEQNKSEQHRELMKKRAEYRQYWTSNVKLPIDDSLIHCRQGIRRIGPPPASAKNVALPPSLWSEAGAGSASQRVDPEGVLMVYLFLQTFAPYLSLGRYDIGEFHGFLVSETLHPTMVKTLITLYRFLEPELILASDSLIQLLDREEQQFLQTYGKNAYNSRAGLQQAVTKLKSDLLFYRHLFESAPVTDKTIWSLTVHAASFISGPGVVELKEDLFFADADGADGGGAGGGGVELETSWVIDEGLDYKDFVETSAASRGRVIKTLVEKLLDTAIIKRVLDVNAEVRVRLQAELVQINKNEQRLSARILNAKRLLESGELGSRSENELKKQIEADSAYKVRMLTVRSAIENMLPIQPHSSEPLGLDRHGNEYFSYPFRPNTVLVWLKKLHTVGTFSGEKALEKLIDTLDVRGTREDALRKALIGLKSEESLKPWSSSVAQMPEAELFALLEKDHLHASSAFSAEAGVADAGATKVAMPAGDLKAEEDLPESFAFLRQTLAVARESTKKSLDVWMGDTEQVGEATAQDVAQLANSLFQLIPEEDKSGTFAKTWAALKTASENQSLPEPVEFAGLVENLAEKFLEDATEMQVLFKIAAGRAAEVVGEEVECAYCSKRCVNSVLLDVHMKKWCKQKNTEQKSSEEDTMNKLFGDQDAPAAVSSGATPGGAGAAMSWVEAVEAVPMSFPSISQAKQLTTNVASTGAGPFVCEGCGKEFGQQSALSLHMRKWCKGAEGVASASKSKTAADSADAMEAEGEVGGAPFKCPHCKREMSTYNGLTVHLGRWCPEKSYATAVDLTTGWSDEDEPSDTTANKPQMMETVDTPAESVEEILLGGEVAKVSQSTAALALTWLLWRALASQE